MHVALVGAELEENLAIRYLWGALEQAGHEVTHIVFDGPEQTEQAARELAGSGAQLAGMSMVFTWRAREFAALADRARQLGYGGHLVAGGHFAAFHAEELLRDVPAIDSIGCGEGEELMVRLADGLERLADVDGLVWRDGDGIVRNPPATKPPDLDRLPEPPRKEPFDEFLGLRITNLLASRGCTHSCAFCSIAAWHRLCGGPRLRLRRPEQVAAEMARLFHRGVRIFNFHDDNFFLHDPDEMRTRITTLAGELERRGVGQIAFAVKSRPDTVDEELFAMLKSMGLFRVFLGIEAGTAESLSQLRRRQTVESNERALAVVNRLDLHACFNLLLLNPESTLEDLATNVAFLRRHPHNPMNFCRTEVYAGTPLERQLRRQGRLVGDYWGQDYVITDPRAQAAFEITFECFETRNFGEHSLHHRAMHVDYEHQLLGDFYGSDPALRRQVKQFIVAVNLNTCDHLERIIAALRDDALGRAAQAALAERMTVQVEADNRRLMEQGDALLAEIRNRAQEQPTGTPAWARAASAAGLAATLTLSTAACEKPADLPMPEMAPRPTAPVSPTTTDTGQFASPPPDASKPGPPLGSAGTIRSQFDREILPFVASRIVPEQEVEIELWTDDRGKVSKVLLRRATLTATIERDIRQRLAQWSLNTTDGVAKRFVLLISPAQLAAARPPPAPVPMPEMAPKPVPRPEMAPKPVPRPEMAPRPWHKSNK